MARSCGSATIEYEEGRIPLQQALNIFDAHLPAAAVGLTEVDEEQLKAALRLDTRPRMSGRIILSERIVARQPRCIVLQINT
jgi:hypothetical protein